jgi:hypothetical protein
VIRWWQAASYHQPVWENYDVRSLKTEKKKGLIFISHT